MRLLAYLAFAASTPTACVSAEDLAKHFSKCQFFLNQTKIEAYIADTNPNRSRGLMHVTSLPSNTGMLFVFEESQHLSFWMKNTRIPLAIGFFDAGSKLVDIQEMSVPNSVLEVTPVSYQSRVPAVLALEMNRGWFTKNKIENGAKLRLSGPCSSKLLAVQLQTAQKARH